MGQNLAAGGVAVHEDIVGRKRRAAWLRFCRGGPNAADHRPATPFCGSPHAYNFPKAAGYPKAPSLADDRHQSRFAGAVQDDFGEMRGSCDEITILVVSHACR
jgi:hypothetical protein